MVWYRPVDEYAYAWLPASSECSDLVAAVNRVARKFNGRPGGSFYFNEYNQVLKPVFGDGMIELRYVGEFPSARLQFSLFDGEWSNRPPHAPGGELEPGDDWVGPRCGIPYWLETRNNLRIFRPSVMQPEDDFVLIRHREYLDDYNRSYRTFARVMRDAKGRSGGKFYVTESGSLWAPYWQGPAPTDWAYRFVGCLWDYVDEWYPKWG